MNSVSVVAKYLLPACLACFIPLSAVAQTVTVSPTSIAFGNQVQSTASAVKTVTLKNGQSTAITVTGITPSLSDYTQTNNCPVSPSTLAAGKSCTISLTFTPSALGSRAGTLTITDTGTKSPTVSLSGTGIAAVTVSQTSITFANQVVGVKSAASKVTLTNNQSKTLSITKIAATLPDYTQTNTCPTGTSTLGAGASCTISVFFTPTVAGLRSDTLTITDNAVVSPTVSLTGTGILAVTASPASLTFASQAMGTTSGAQTVTLTNNQSSSLKITSVTSSLSDFIVSSACGTSLAAGKSCTASVTFSPKATGSRTGTLSFVDNANNTPQIVSLSGTGAAATLVSIAVTPASSTIAAGTTQQYTATGTYTDKSTQNLTNSVTWSSSASGVATINASTGLATGVVAGSATITATSGSISGSTGLTVGSPNLLSIAITPSNSSFALGTTEALKATATYSDGSTQDVTSSVTWNSLSTAIAAVSNKGVASAVAVGGTSITATSGSIVGTTPITVTPATLVSIAVTPTIPSIPLGTTQQFAATGTFTDSSTQNLTAAVVWSSDATTVATISNQAGNQGLATSVAPGPANITATSGAITGTTKLTVTNAALLSITVTPANPTIALGTNQQFTATGSYTDGNTQDLTSSATWASDAGLVATVNKTGLANTVATGSANISATSGSVSGSTVLTVTPAQLVSLAINPQTASVPAGLTQQFTATGTYTDGSTQDLTQTGSWSSSVGTVATVGNDASTKGLASTLSAGTTSINVVSGSLTASATLTVQPASLLSIAISPTAPTIPLGTNQQFTATGSYTNGNTQDVTASVTWNSSSAGVAIMSNSAGSNGLATSAGTGTATISAALGSISNTTTLTVATAALVSITVSPASASIPVGTTQQFTATGNYTDKTTQDLTSSATWTSETPLVASVGNGGVAVALRQGAATISASSAGIQGSASLSVGPPVLVSLTVSPTSASVAAGQTQQFAAFGTYSDSSVLDLTSSVSWTSSAPAIASINGGGVATGQKQGSANITATLGVISASATLNVTAPVLLSIAVTPATASIPNGTTQQFTATGTYSDNSTQDLTQSASWTSSAPDVATVSSTGMATGAGIGTANITATSGGSSGSASITVAQPALLSIAITPSNPSLALGTGQALKATGTYTDGSTLDLTGSVTWNVDDSTIVAIDAQGNATSVAIGSTKVTATSSSVTGFTKITVTQAVLVSIAVTPAIPSIPLGTTQQFMATGTFTDNSTQDVTQTVQWSSDTTSVATINSTGTQIGQATGTGTGTATITATSGAITGNTTLTVGSAVLVSIAVTPAYPTIALGTTQQFTATGTFTDGKTQDLTTTATWSSEDLTTATISKTGLATSAGLGTSNIAATSGGISGNTGLTVSAAELVSLAINPPSAAVPVGVTQQFTATGTYTDSTTQDVTQSAHWSSSDGSVATISTGSATAGVASALKPGTTSIGVSSGSISASATLTVNAAALVSIAISPQNASIPLGESQQFAATGTYTDGSMLDVTSVVNWSSSQSGVLVISNAAGSNGLATTANVGSATITASSNAITSSTTATVGTSVLMSITVTPANSSIAQGYTLQFSATGTFSDNSTLDLTQTATWLSSIPGVAAIGPNGLASAAVAGNTTISATSGAISGSTVLGVTPAVPISLSVSPTNPSIYVNGQQQFTATLLYSNGNSIDVSSSVAWTSSALGVASIGSSGLAAGAGAGSASIQASWGSGALIAASVLTVMAPTVTITPASASVTFGGTQQFSSTVVGSSNQSVTWAVDGITGGNSSVGTISASGFYTGPQMIGSHAITAKAQANTASVGLASLTIGALVPVANTFFGMHLHFAASPVPSTMDAVGRIWDSNAAQWPNLNMANGTYVWTNLDAVLANYKNAGINDILYTLWRVPKWASSNPTDTACDYASIGPNFTGACDLPTDLNADGTGTDLTWRNWVQAIAQHVNDLTYLQNHARISYWEPCNECYRSPTLDPGYGTSGASVAYRGTYAQLLRMMQDARCIILGIQSDLITASNTQCGQAGYPVIGIDPTAKMVMPSVSPITNSKPYPQIMQNILYCTCANNSCSASTTGCTTGSAGSKAMDILSVHVYPNSTNYKPETIPAEVALVRADLSTQDLTKPLWSDEGGWGSNTTATQISNGDPDMEAAWVARFHLMMWASGFVRSYWYEWDNAAYGTLWSPTSINGCTTSFTGGGFLCKSGTAYQQVHDWMVGSTLTNCSSVGTGWTCNLVQPNGRAAQVLWDTSQTCSAGTCGTLQYSVSPSFNTYKDLDGVSHSIVNSTVPVGIKPILIFTQ